MKTVHRVCPFCEATCGLEIEVDGERVTRVRGDRRDPFSRGFVCPKAHGVKDLHHDPDRLRRPLRRTATGWEEISWPAAFDLVGERLLAVRKAHGNDAVGMYTGNPVVHDLGALAYRPVLAQALASKSLFNSAAIDTLPKIVQTGLMFGRPFPLAVPVPDIDRTKYLLVIGANPMVSHGSLMTMPDAPARLRGVIERGGKLVVIDPRRSETAKIASEHHFIRPGADAAFLLALVHVLFEEGLVDLGAAEGRVEGLSAVRAAAIEFAPEAVASHCGIAAPVIRRLARELAAAESAACYGRLGTCVQEFGTLASWGVDLVNILTGNLDRPGGAMFTTPAAPLDAALPRRPFEMARWRSRVSGQPEVEGLIPSSTMAEEMLTPGRGQVRAMILLMTNPLRSAANTAELERAFAGLEFLVAIDFYLNETTRHAHVILPAPAAAEQPGYELGLYLLSVRNVAKWSDPIRPPDGETPDTWQVFSEIGARLLGVSHLPRQAIDDLVFRRYADGAVASSSLRWAGLTVDEVCAKVDGGIGPARMVDLLLRVGPYGDGFGRNPAGLTLAKLRSHEHGLDLGPLQPRLDEVIRTESGKIELAPQLMIDDLPRLRARLAQPAPGLLLIGRRDMRGSNSFMHNLPSLVKGRDRCTLHVSREDAARTGLAHGGRARVTSRVGSVVAPVEVTDDLMPGVVSLPHGWGHDRAEARLHVAREHAGVNTNLLTDNQAYDAASGTAVLFGTPVTLEPANSA